MNLSAFFDSDYIFGGTTLGDNKIEIKKDVIQYYLTGNRGDIEVSKRFFKYSQIHGISILVTLFFGILGLVLYKIGKKREEKIANKSYQSDSGQSCDFTKV